MFTLKTSRVILYVQVRVDSDSPQSYKEKRIHYRQEHTSVFQRMQGTAHEVHFDSAFSKHQWQKEDGKTRDRRLKKRIGGRPASSQAAAICWTRRVRLAPYERSTSSLGGKKEGSEGSRKRQTLPR